MIGKLTAKNRKTKKNARASTAHSEFVSKPENPVTNSEK